MAVQKNVLVRIAKKNPSKLLKCLDREIAILVCMLRARRKLIQQMCGARSPGGKYDMSILDLVASCPSSSICCHIQSVSIDFSVP